MVTDPELHAQLIERAKEAIKRGWPASVPGAEMNSVYFDAQFSEHRIPLTFGFPPGVRYFVYADRHSNVEAPGVGDFVVVNAGEAGFTLRKPAGFIGWATWSAFAPDVRRRNIGKMMDRKPLEWRLEGDAQ
jgi:hypothetical protein